MEFPGRSGSSDRSFTDMFQSASSLFSSHSDLLQGASSLFSSHEQQPPTAPHESDPDAAPARARAPAKALHSAVDDEDAEEDKGEPSDGDALSSAQVVFQAAKAKFGGGGGGEGQEIDTGRVAGALGDLVGAAGHYGKLGDDSKYGQYAHKAEEYLHGYEHKHQHPSSAHAHAPAQRRDDQGY